MLVKGINKAFKEGLGSVGNFLNSRLVMSDHLDCPSLSRKAIKDSKTT